MIFTFFQWQIGASVAGTLFDVSARTIVAVHGRGFANRSIDVFAGVDHIVSRRICRFRRFLCARCTEKAFDMTASERIVYAEQKVSLFCVHSIYLATGLPFESSVIFGDLLVGS